MISLLEWASLCLGIIMSSSCNIFMVIIISVMYVKSGSSKVHVVASQDALAVKVGHDIIARMGKDGIELEKNKNGNENRLRELLEDPSENDPEEEKNSQEDYSSGFKSGLNQFLEKSWTGPSFYSTLFWIVFGILIGQVARDLFAYLQTHRHGKQDLSSSCHQDLPPPPPPPPYKLMEDKMETA